MELFATDITSPEGLAGGGALIAIGAIVQYLVRELMTYLKERRTANSQDQQGQRAARREDEETAIKRCWEYADRVDEELKAEIARNAKQRSDFHEYANAVNDRVNRYMLLIGAQARHIRYQAALLKKHRIAHEEWVEPDDSLHAIALPPPPNAAAPDAGDAV